MRNVGRIAERPGIGFAGFRVNSVGDDLLPWPGIRFFRRCSVSGDQVGGDLGERNGGAERNCALGRLADARQDIAAVFEAFAYQFLNRDCGGSLRISASSVGVNLVKFPVLLSRGQVLVHIFSISTETFSVFCHSRLHRDFVLKRNRRVAACDQGLPNVQCCRHRHDP